MHAGHDGTQKHTIIDSSCPSSYGAPPVRPDPRLILAANSLLSFAAALALGRAAAFALAR